MFNIGDIAVEQKPSIDGEEMPKRYYRILGRVDSIDDVAINSYLVKEIYKDENDNWIDNNPNDNRAKFSLSRCDCKFLNIEYQEGIEVYPYGNSELKEYVDEKKLAEEAKKVEEEREAAKKHEEEVLRNVANALSDSFNTNKRYVANTLIGKYTHVDAEFDRYTGKNVILKLSGFMPYEHAIITPDKVAVSVEQFEQCLEVISNVEGEKTLKKGAHISYKLLTEKEHGCLINEDGCIFIELNDVKWKSSVSSNDKRNVSKYFDVILDYSVVAKKILDADEESRKMQRKVSSYLGNIDRYNRYVSSYWEALDNYKYTPF